MTPASPSQNSTCTAGWGATHSSGSACRDSTRVPSSVRQKPAQLACSKRHEPPQPSPADRCTARHAADRRNAIRELDAEAHVASSVTGLLDELAPEEPFGSPCAVVLALGREKDARAVLKALRGHADRVHCTTSHGGPLATGEELAQLGRELGIDARDAGSAREALQAALSGDSSWVLVLGSFYLAGELRPLLLELDQDKCSPSSQTSCSPTPS